MDNARAITQDDLERFLAALEKSRSVIHAAKRAGISRQSAYDRRDSDPVFAARWAKCVERNGSELYESAFNRALFGWEEPVYGAGGLVGKKRKYSDALTIFMLKLAGHIPKDETTEGKDVVSDLTTLMEQEKRRKGRKPG